MRIQYNHNLVKLAKKLRNNPTNAEIVVWNFLKDKQIYGFDFHRQKPIGNYIADFYCYDLRLVIEIDGISHENHEVIENDRKKEEYISRLGFRLIRFTDDEVLGSGNRVEAEIRALVSEIAEHTPLPPLARGGIH